MPRRMRLTASKPNSSPWRAFADAGHSAKDKESLPEPFVYSRMIKTTVNLHSNFASLTLQTFI